MAVSLGRNTALQLPFMLRQGIKQPLKRCQSLILNHCNGRINPRTRRQIRAAGPIRDLDRLLRGSHEILSLRGDDRFFPWVLIPFARKSLVALYSELHEARVQFRKPYIIPYGFPCARTRRPKQVDETYGESTCSHRQPNDITP